MYQLNFSLAKCIFRNNIEFLEISFNSFQNIFINETYRRNVDSDQLGGKSFPIIGVLHFFNIRSCSLINLAKTTNFIFLGRGGSGGVSLIP